MKKLFPLISFFILGLFLTACNNEPKSPFEVTQAFWHAVETKNVDQIKKLISKKSLHDEILTENVVSISKPDFGKITIDGNNAEVETTVVVESDHPSTVSLDTFLVKENETWKVDYHATVDTLSSQGQLAQAIRDLRTFGEKFSKDFSREFESSMDELDKAMPDVEKQIKNLGDQIKEQVPELKKQFEDLAKQLQQALKESQTGKAQNPEQDSI